MKTFQSISVVIGICLFIVTIGCGSDDLQKASGKVLVDGKPVTDGTMEFYPVGGGRTANATIQSDGSFIISYRKPGDGLPPGEYKVAIISNLFEPYGKAKTPDPTVGQLDNMPTTEAQGKLTYVVPKIYNSIYTTPLIQKVGEGSEAQNFTIDIPSK